MPVRLLGGRAVLEGGWGSGGAEVDAASTAGCKAAPALHKQQGAAGAWGRTRRPGGRMATVLHITTSCCLLMAQPDLPSTPLPRPAPRCFERMMSEDEEEQAQRGGDEEWQAEEGISGEAGWCGCTESRLWHGSDSRAGRVCMLRLQCLMVRHLPSWIGPHRLPLPGTG